MVQVSISIIQLCLRHWGCLPEKVLFISFEFTNCVSYISMTLNQCTGDEAVVKILIENGVDINAKSLSGKKVHEGCLQ